MIDSFKKYCFCYSTTSKKEMTRKRLRGRDEKDEQNKKDTKFIKNSSLRNNQEERKERQGLSKDETGMTFLCAEGTER